LLAPSVNLSSQAKSRHKSRCRTRVGSRWNQAFPSVLLLSCGGMMLTGRT